MTSYKDIKAQIAELQRTAEEARNQEIEGAVAQIKALMREYEISVEDLVGKSKKMAGKKAPNNVQFQDGAGNTWSGRGRMPAWIKGQDKEQFRVG
jgi:DNA-binding protein H-NS